MRIQEICSSITDGSHNPPQEVTDSEYLMLSSKNIFDNNITFVDPRYLRKEDFEIEDRRTNIQAGDVLLTIVGTVGRCAVVPERAPKFTLQRSVAVLHPREDVCSSRFLMYALQGKRSYIEGRAKGVAQKGIYLGEVANIEVPIPDKSTQAAIILRLDKIASIIQNRQQQLSALDDLIKARFVEMFGDPFSNPLNWECISFKESSLRLSDGPFGSNLKSEHYSETGVRVIRLGNIGVGRFIDEDKSFIPPEHYENLKKYTCHAGEIVIGTLGDPNLRACIIPKEIGIAVNKADCVHYIPDPSLLNTEFACQYVNCPETLLLAHGMIHGQTRSRVSSGQIAEMPIFIPPLELQNVFSDFVHQIDKSKFAIQKSLNETPLFYLTA